MTDETRSAPREDPDEIERDADATPAPDKSADPPEQANPWLKEGADSPDAADIEDPTEQR